MVKRKWLGIIMALMLTFSCGLSSCARITEFFEQNFQVGTNEPDSPSDPNEGGMTPDDGSTENGDPNEGDKDPGTDSGEEEEDTEKILTDYVDFVVDVEEGRDIRVLQLTDVQTISSEQKRYPTRVTTSGKADTFTGYERYIGQVITRYDPDFIIMTGDNVYGEFDDSGEQHLNLISFMDSFKIPWAPVFGNHDNESNMGVDWQCEQFEKSKYCLFKQRELTGNGNYSVALTQGGEVKRVFYMLDSNGCGGMSAISLANGHSTTSVGFGNDQISWYTTSITRLKKAYPDVKLSMAFHIQLSIFGTAFQKYGYGTFPIDLDTLPVAQAAGDFGYLGAQMKSPWDTTNTVWRGIKNLGVDSIFVGHEHRNSASVMYQGVRLTYGQKSSTFDRYNTDSNGPIMGGTYIDLLQSDGSIADAGLYLYDAELGYEKPSVDQPSIPSVPATETEFDFNGEDFDAAVTTETIKNEMATSVENTNSVPAGVSGGVYAKSTSDFASVGFKFPKEINADRLLGIKVRMYVSDYTVQSGKIPLLRIYNDEQNSILNSEEFSFLGGVTGEWVSVDILDLVKGSSGIIVDGKLQAFTLVYRFYGSTAGTVYFDSVTLLSDGDPYEFDEVATDVQFVCGKPCSIFSIEDFDGKSGILAGGESVFLPIDQKDYCIRFNVSASAFTGTLNVYGYTEESKISELGVKISATFVKIGKGSANITWNEDEIYRVEVGFVELYNGNTVYVYIKINDVLTLWEYVEAYGNAGNSGGNVAIVSSSEDDSFELGA